MENKSKKWSQIICFTCIVGLFGLFGLLILALPGRRFSENENRYLARFKPVTLAGCLDGSVQKNVTDAANDQFPGRDFWMKLSTSLQRGFGKKDVGGVYFGKEGYYFEKVLDSELSVKRYENNLDYVDVLAEASVVPTYLMPVPSAGICLEGLLPDNAVLYDADEIYETASSRLSNAQLVIVEKQLEQELKKGRQIFFKTDHHWTTYGAYAGYDGFCEATGRSCAPLDDFNLQLVDTAFLGTLYSKAPVFVPEQDELWIPKALPESRVWIDGEEKTFYHMDKLGSKDKYAVYFGGNYASVRIKRSDGQGRRLFLVKDSYANSMVPYLLHDYDDIFMVDLRYDNESVAEQIAGFAPDDILVLYELSNFAQDMNLFKVTK